MQVDFKDILWMPVDIPKFDRCQELIDDFSIDFNGSIKNSDYDVRGQLFLKKSENHSISTPKEGLTSSQLAVMEYCKKHLPFTDYINFKIHHIENKGMKMHYDFSPKNNNFSPPQELWDHVLDHEPMGFRMVVHGAKSGDIGIQKPNGEVVIPVMPEDTDWYSISHSGTLHGTPPHVNNLEDRYVLFANGWCDKEKHEELINRSIEKYKDFIVKK